jgi:DNA-binding NtrC family response regulator
MADDRLLVVGDCGLTRKTLSRFFSSKGLEIDAVKSGVEAYSVCSKNNYQVVFLCPRVQGESWVNLFEKIRSFSPSSIPVLIEQYPSIEDQKALSAMNGLSLKNINSNMELEALMASFGSATQALASESNEFRISSLEKIIGSSDEMKQLFDMVMKVADSDSTILIAGESGTGKELIARAIHFNSSRARNALVPINCAAIPEELLESELFGHVKGSFTGAISTRQGRFEVANSGTLFLDEIGDMPPSLQAKLLRAIQTQRFEPVGSAKTIEVDTRIIAATNVDLEKAVKEKRFREDLYYRLSVIPLHIPALRERRSDIPHLISHFIKQFNEQKNKDITGVDDEAMDLFMGYRWQGNVRELENLIERIVILKGKGIITSKDLPIKFFENSPRTFTSQTSETVASKNQELSINLPQGGLDLKAILNKIESDLMVQALERTGWNKNKASSLLKMNRTTLVEKLKKKGITNGV